MSGASGVAGDGDVVSGASAEDLALLARLAATGRERSRALAELLQTRLVGRRVESAVYVSDPSHEPFFELGLDDGTVVRFGSVGYEDSNPTFVVDS